MIALRSASERDTHFERNMTFFYGRNIAVSKLNTAIKSMRYTIVSLK